MTTADELASGGGVFPLFALELASGVGDASSGDELVGVGSSEVGAGSDEEGVGVGVDSSELPSLLCVGSAELVVG